MRVAHRGTRRRCHAVVVSHPCNVKTAPLFVVNDNIFALSDGIFGRKHQRYFTRGYLHITSPFCCPLLSGGVRYVNKCSDLWRASRPCNRVRDDAGSAHGQRDVIA